MATLTGGTIASGNTDFDIILASEAVAEKVIANNIFSFIKENNGFNYKPTAALGAAPGTEVSLATVPRDDSTGDDIDQSAYPQAGLSEAGTRKIRVNLLRRTRRFPKKNSIYARRDSHGVMTPDMVQKLTGDWLRNVVSLGPLYQLAGSTATSVSAPLVSSSASFSGADLNNVKGMVAGIAPSSIYTAYGSGAALADPSAITATNAILTYQDLEAARKAIARTYSGILTWERSDKDGLLAGGFMGESAWAQLMNQAKAAGANMTISELHYSQIQGNVLSSNAIGSRKMGKNGYNEFVIPELGFKFMILPDDMLPRADNAGTENALSRTCLLFGANALDLAIADAGEGMGKQGVPGVSIIVDEDYNKIDPWGYVSAMITWASKKAVNPGFANNIANSYDNSTYVIKHSVAS